MKQLIHRLTTDIQFLYACIAYEESSTETEITIVTETKLSKLYPTKKTVKGMVSIGEDYWGRYSFKDEKEQYYCELDGELYFKGNSMDGEPHYPVKETIMYDVPDYDSELIEFKPYIDKVKKYILDNTELNLKLVNYETAVSLDSNNIANSKIICKYTFEV